MTPTEQHNTNPFFSKHYGTPFDTAPFDRIRLEHYEPAFMEGIRQDEAFINSIVNNPEPPSFDNTIAVTTPDDLLERVSKVFFNLLSAETDDAMNELAQKISPVLTEHANSIMFNRPYFERVKAVYLQYYTPEGTPIPVAAADTPTPAAAAGTPTPATSESTPIPTAEAGTLPPSATVPADSVSGSSPAKRLP